MCKCALAGIARPCSYCTKCLRIDKRKLLERQGQPKIQENEDIDEFALDLKNHDYSTVDFIDDMDLDIPLNDDDNNEEYYRLLKLDNGVFNPPLEPIAIYHPELIKKDKKNTVAKSKLPAEKKKTYPIIAAGPSQRLNNKISPRRYTKGVIKTLFTPQTAKYGKKKQLNTKNCSLFRKILERNHLKRHYPQLFVTNQVSQNSKQVVLNEQAKPKECATSSSTHSEKKKQNFIANNVSEDNKQVVYNKEPMSKECTSSGSTKNNAHSGIVNNKKILCKNQTKIVSVDNDNKKHNYDTEKAQRLYSEHAYTRHPYRKIKVDKMKNVPN